mgnify:CR=1 FL=1
MKNKLLNFWYNYQIKIIYNSIRDIELNIYFDGWTGKDCVEYNNYYYKKIEELKLKLKNYEITR